MENIKILRERTGAGMADCKQALDEAGGDIEKAIEILRKKGIAKAAKRAEREAKQGVVKVALNSVANEGYMIELNAETDFVAKNNDFQTLAAKILAVVAASKPADLAALLALPLESGTVQEAVEHLSGVIGEKIVLSQVAVLSGATVGAYVHANNAIGVLVGLNQPGQAELARDIAMQVAAANPRYIKPEEVPAEELDKEKDVYREQLKKEGKPAEMMEKILLGKINKYYEEVCLVKQEYIKDDSKKVADILGQSQVEKFIKFSL